jgi:hypothetical protein
MPPSPRNGIKVCTYLIHWCGLEKNITSSFLSHYASYTLGKGKVAPVPNKAPCHKGTWGSGGVTPPFLTLTLDAGE